MFLSVAIFIVCQKLIESELLLVVYLISLCVGGREREPTYRSTKTRNTPRAVSTHRCVLSRLRRCSYEIITPKKETMHGIFSRPGLLSAQVVDQQKSLFV